MHSSPTSQEGPRKVCDPETASAPGTQYADVSCGLGNSHLSGSSELALWRAGQLSPLLQLGEGRLWELGRTKAEAASGRNFPSQASG